MPPPPTHEAPTQKATPSASPKAKVHVQDRSAGPAGVQFSTMTNVLLHNVMTGLCADIPNFGNGKVEGPIRQFTCDGTSADNQLWDLVVTGKGQGPNGADFFMIRNSKDRYCADLPGSGAVVRRTHVQEYGCRPGLGDNQVWYLQKRPGGYWVRNYVSHQFCLDVLGVNGAGGKDASLTVVECRVADDHVWSLS
jgi:hypothetical protein